MKSSNCGGDSKRARFPSPLGRRGPSDDLRLHLEAIQHLDPDEKAVVRALIESMLLRHEARRFAPAS